MSCYHLPPAVELSKVSTASSTATGAVQAIYDSFAVGELACLLAPCMYPLFCLAKLLLVPYQRVCSTLCRDGTDDGPCTLVCSYSKETPK